MSEALKQIMAARDLSRAITALYLEVDESIVNDIRSKVDAAFQPVRDERDRLALDLKKRIWLLHGSRMNHLLYGDDGRMDCNVCLREYARATLEQCYEWEIADACALVAKAALTPAGGG